MTEPVPLDAFYDLKQLRGLVVSPDGERAAFLTSEFDPDEDERRTSLFVVPTDGSDDPHRLTRASDASSPKWSPDGRRLGFVAARDEDVSLSVGDGVSDVDGDEDDGTEEGGDDENGGTGGDGPSPQVWAFDLTRGGDARQLTDREEGVADFDWAPDGHRIVVAARDPTDDEADYLRARRDENAPIETERLQHKRDGSGWTDHVTSYLFVVDVDSREEVRLDAAHDNATGDGLQPAWGPDGVAFVADHGDRPDDRNVADVHSIAADGSDHRVLTDGDAACTAPCWSPDGNRLAYVRNDAGDVTHPSEVWVTDGDDHWSVSASLDRTLGRYGGHRWTDDGLFATMGDEGRTRLVRLDPGEDDPSWTWNSQGARDVTWFDCAGGIAVFGLNDPATGHDVHAAPVDALDDGSTTAVRLTETAAAVRERYEGPVHAEVTYESDGVEVDAHVYLPPDFDSDDPDTRPLVLVPHGGPTAYDAPSYRFDDVVWTSRGYVVCRPNYRGSASYGHEFAATIRGRWGTDEVTDCENAARHLVDEGWVDPDRQFVTGFSYGGITTGYLVTRTDRFAAAAAEHGIYDYRACFGTDDCQRWWENDYGLPWENPDDYDASSIITDVGGVETPLLVTAGGHDWRCPPTQSEQLYVSVRKQGVPAKLVVYPDEHHDVDAPDRAVHRLEQLTEWFETHDSATDD